MARRLLVMTIVAICLSLLMMMISTVSLAQTKRKGAPDKDAIASEAGREDTQIFNSGGHAQRHHLADNG
ncbi:MAG: hypothetical protein IPG76_03125 [Acidobacteria bacterium]|nr:hypothetical protein [Acidobacteriota bacterium]